MDKQPEIEWLYPDLMSKEGLIHILKKRYVKRDEDYLESLDKESLVAMYNKYILPLPQRKYRINRHGREMSKRQILHMKKRKITLGDDDETLAKKQRTSCFQEFQGPSHGLVNNFSGSSSSTSRLKPPPSAVNLEKKVVQLSSKKSCNSSTLVNSPSKSSTDGVKKVVRLKSSSDDGVLTDIKRLKLEPGAKTSPLKAKGLTKISWP